MIIAADAADAADADDTQPEPEEYIEENNIEDENQTRKENATEALDVAKLKLAILHFLKDS